MRHYYKGTIKQGKFKLNSRVAFEASVRHLRDGNYLVALLNLTNKNQREWQAFYFAILGEWSNDVGLAKAELHDLVKTELFPDLFEDITSTTDLSNEQWNILFFNLENFLILKFENR